MFISNILLWCCGFSYLNQCNTENWHLVISNKDHDIPQLYYIYYNLKNVKKIISLFLLDICYCGIWLCRYNYFDLKCVVPKIQTFYCSFLLIFCVFYIPFRVWLCFFLKVQHLLQTNNDLQIKCKDESFIVRFRAFFNGVSHWN